MSGDEIERRLGGKPIVRLLLMTQHPPPDLAKLRKGIPLLSS
jgi:hypothetical protein